MAKNKIERIDQEIAKTREKIAEQQEKLKALEAQKTEAENLEIVQMVRAVRMTPAQLNALLAGGMGMRPLMGFQQVGVNVFFAGQYPTVGAAVQAFLEGKLPPFTMDFTCGGGGHH